MYGALAYILIRRKFLHVTIKVDRSNVNRDFFVYVDWKLGQVMI